MPYEYDYEEGFDLEEESESEDEYLDDEVLTYACEDCDHRWEDASDEFYDMGPEGLICPMCGSSNVIEL